MILKNGLNALNELLDKCPPSLTARTLIWYAKILRGDATQSLEDFRGPFESALSKKALKPTLLNT